MGLNQLNMKMGMGNSDAGIPLWSAGVNWDSNLDSYTRTGDLAGETLGVSPGNSKLPIHRLMQRCLLKDNGSVNYYLKSTDSTKKPNGDAADITTGIDGQVMVEIQGPIYYKITFDGDDRLFELASYAKSGFIKHPAFTNGNCCYIGAYEGSMYDVSEGAMVPSGSVHTSLYAAGDKMCSLSGQYPKTNETRAEFRGMAAQRGTGWHQNDNVVNSLIQMLYLVEFADWNAQSTIGAGRTALTGGDWTAGSYIGQCGLSNGKGNGTFSVSNGGVNYGTDYMTYRGIENWWGNVWKWIDGVNVFNSTPTGSQLWLATDPSVYADDTQTGYTLSGALAETDGYITDVIDTLGVWPASVGGSSVTYVSDYSTTFFDNNPDIGWRAALVSSGANDGPTAGPFFVYLAGSPSGTNINVGGRISYRKAA